LANAVRFLTPRSDATVSAFESLFEFQKRTQLFVGMNNKALSVIAMRVNNPNCSLRRNPLLRPTTPNPALIILLTMISRYFIGSLPLSLPDEFPMPRSPADNFSGLIGLWERGRHQTMPCQQP
jgi:hypothetical protein